MIQPCVGPGSLVRTINMAADGIYTVDTAKSCKTLVSMVLRLPRFSVLGVMQEFSSNCGTHKPYLKH